MKKTLNLIVAFILSLTALFATVSSTSAAKLVDKKVTLTKFADPFYYTVYLTEGERITTTVTRPTITGPSTTKVRCSVNGYAYETAWSFRRWDTYLKEVPVHKYSADSLVPLASMPDYAVFSYKADKSGYYTICVSNLTWGSEEYNIEISK